MAEPLTPAESEAAGQGCPPAGRPARPWRVGAAPEREKPGRDPQARRTRPAFPELVPIRHGRMGVSAFTFYRGAAGIMAADLGPAPRHRSDVQLCGDAHLSNFGVFAAPDRRLIFDINDFDETHPGPFEWDVKRLVASFAIGGRDLGFKRERSPRRRWPRRRRVPPRDAPACGDAHDRRLVRAARCRCARAVPIRRSRKKAAKRFDKARAKAESKNSLRAFAKLTHSVDGELRIISDPPLIVPVEEVFRGHSSEVLSMGRLSELLGPTGGRWTATSATSWRAIATCTLARKVVGVGSVGTRAWIVLLLGRDSEDPLFLQAKEAEASVLEGVRRQEQVQAAGPPRRRGPAPDAGGQRHLPRLADRGRDPTARLATSTSASSGTARARPRWS